MNTLIVFSHLRWNFVYQRPQHLLSRLAKRWRIVFIEEPVPASPANTLERIEASPGVQVWRPHVTGEAPGFHDDHLAVLQRMVNAEMRAQDITDYWTWFYTPMALPLANGLAPRGVVYDCMDELSAFKNAPRQLLQRENALFKLADLVFTGGRSIFNAKRGRHPDVHCFPSSVDAEHFRRVRGEHPLHMDIPRPRLGYCGVIDERINLDLVDAIAAARPEWEVVMVGPTAKIDPAALPRRDNIHWLGQQSYDDLPSFISGWDVCLMPFALNDATRYISPTKTLEYMACGKPSVSTSIRDVVEPYGELVRIADTPEGFIADIEMIMARTPAEQLEHAKALAEVVARTSWDATADAMAALIAQADERLQDSSDFVDSQPAADEAPLQVSSVAQAVSQVAQPEKSKARVTAA
ncbi:MULTISPECIES: glycosyltransferase [Ramlibacter]|uniref:Glycosyltransferase n=1 Tax=Ramlibacter aquaticus TaxID=2780094 RepID=A0ABR9SIT4_9BURK|nr:MULTISPECIES: glycosyltransferase [Ramlibacter]MBE7942253.1 glycosyltransferase [Ramlibacter aquaticus]